VPAPLPIDGRKEHAQSQTLTRTLRRREEARGPDFCEGITEGKTADGDWMGIQGPQSLVDSTRQPSVPTSFYCAAMIHMAQEA
jgi:hypothetical protein